MPARRSGLWLYQMSEEAWPSAQYRAEIWEASIVTWPTRQVQGTDRPRPGDRMICWYARTGSDLPGVVGWGVVLGYNAERREVIWRPAPPTDALKMRPVYDDAVVQAIDRIRGKYPRKTMWPITGTDGAYLTDRVRGWFGGGGP